MVIRHTDVSCDFTERQHQTNSADKNIEPHRQIYYLAPT